MSKPVETLYATVDRETLRQLQADSEELARVKTSNERTAFSELIRVRDWVKNRRGQQETLKNTGQTHTMIEKYETLDMLEWAIERCQKAQPARQAGDDAPPCASAYMTSDGRMLIFADKFDAMEWEDRKDLLPLYSLDELNRAELAPVSDDLARIKAEHPIQKCLRENGELIAAQATVMQLNQLLAAKEAEIARVTQERDGYLEVAHTRQVMLQQAQADLRRAQPARQVGDEFEMPEGVTVSKDVMGTAHIQIGDFDFIQVQYQWPYIDNASQNRLVQQIVNLLAQQQEGEGQA